MVIDRERETLFARKASPRAFYDHHWRADGIVILAGVMLTAVILAGPRPLEAAELTARRRPPPPQVSMPSPRATLGYQTGPIRVCGPRGVAMVAPAGGCLSIPTPVVPMPGRGPASRHGTSGHVRAS